MKAFAKYLFVNFCKVFILMIGVFFPIRLHFDAQIRGLFDWCYLTHYVNFNCLDVLLTLIFVVLSIKFLDIDLYYEKRKKPQSHQ